MNIFLIIILGALEAVALLLAVRLWLRHRMSLLPRIFWSLFLLVPVLGLLMYGFVRSDLMRTVTTRDPHRIPMLSMATEGICSDTQTF